MQFWKFIWTRIEQATFNLGEEEHTILEGNTCDRKGTGSLRIAFCMTRAQVTAWRGRKGHVRFRDGVWGNLMRNCLCKVKLAEWSDSPDSSPLESSYYWWIIRCLLHSTVTCKKQTSHERGFRLDCIDCIQIAHDVIFFILMSSDVWWQTDAGQCLLTNHDLHAIPGYG